MLGTVLDPSHGTVLCLFNIFNIREINIKTQSILIDFYFEATWSMPGLLQEDGETPAPDESDS